MAYLLLLGQPGVGKCKLLKEIANNFKNVVWITTTYTIERVRNGLKKDAWIIDAFSWGMKKPLSERDVVVINPTNLNEISLAFSKVLENVREDYLLILNSISGLAVYQPLSKIINLLRVLLVKVENDNSRAIFTLVSGAQEKQFEMGIMMLFPSIVELEEQRIRVLKSCYNKFERGVYSIDSSKEILTGMLS
ncbi:MAG: hypothetical protein QXN34_04050 [Archaeoglobaceae archaeon]